MCTWKSGHFFFASYLSAFVRCVQHSGFFRRSCVLATWFDSVHVGIISGALQMAIGGNFRCVVQHFSSRGLAERDRLRPAFFFEFGHFDFGQFRLRPIFGCWIFGLRKREKKKKKKIKKERTQFVGQSTKSMLGQRVEAPKGGGPEGWRPRRVEAPKGGGPNLEKVGPRRMGSPKFRAFFFPLPPQFSFFLLSFRGPFVEFWWCLKRRGRQLCTFGVLGLSCEALAAPKPPGFHTTAREPERAHFKGPGLHKKHQNSTRRLPRERKRTKMRAGEGKKERNFGRSGGGRSGGGRSGGRRSCGARSGGGWTQTHTATHTHPPNHTPPTHKHTQTHTNTHTQNTHKHTQTDTQTDTQTETHPPNHTQQHTHTHRCRFLSRIPFFYFVPMSFSLSRVQFFILSQCRFFCPVCRFLFCPECLFFCPVCVFFVPTTVCLFCPVCIFFVLWLFLSRYQRRGPAEGRFSGGGGPAEGSIGNAGFGV